MKIDEVTTMEAFLTVEAEVREKTWLGWTVEIRNPETGEMRVLVARKDLHEKSPIHLFEVQVAEKKS